MNNRGRWLVMCLLLFLAVPTSVQVASAQGPVTLQFPGYGAEAHRGQNGQRFSYLCQGHAQFPSGYVVGSRLYGTDLYTDDTGICSAAAHAGVITFENGGPVTIEMRPGSSQTYKGSTRNGITSADWTLGASGSFVVVTGNSPTVTPGGGPSKCDWTGTWDRGGELFSFVQTAAPAGSAGPSSVNGSGVTDPTWQLSATASDNVLTGKWSTSKDSGSIRITISADCNSFDSAWGSGDSFTPFTGHGVRAGPGSDGQPNTSVTNMTIQAGRRKVIAGELVLVPVWLIKASNVANLNFRVSYDANVVKLEGAATKGDLLDNALFSVNPNQSGSVLSGFAQTSGLAGTGTVLNIPFRAVGKAGDRTPLDVTVTTVNEPGGAALQIDKIAGEILIYSNDGTFPPTSGSGLPPPPAMLKGDCDGDGVLTEADALCALEMSVQSRPVDLIMDIDQSGSVDSRDAVIILQRALNK